MNMENQRSPLLGVSFGYYSCQGKSVEDELRSSLWYTKLELEQTKMTVQEELRKKEEQVNQLRELLSKAIRERDEANEKCQSLILDKLLLQQNQTSVVGPIMSGLSSIEEDDHPRSSNNNNGFSSSDCEESIVSSPPIQQPQPQPQPQPPNSQSGQIELVCEKPLPEKGKLLQAVMKAGPLLQTLLLAGPLPQWRHPPPPLESFQIPPVTIPSPPQLLLHQDSFNHLCTVARLNKKRASCESGDDEEEQNLAEVKYQRLVRHDADLFIFGSSASSE